MAGRIPAPVFVGAAPPVGEDVAAALVVGEEAVGRVARAAVEEGVCRVGAFSAFSGDDMHAPIFGCFACFLCARGVTDKRNDGQWRLEVRSRGTRRAIEWKKTPVIPQAVLVPRIGVDDAK